MLTTQELKSRLSFLILGQRGGQNRIQIINALKERPYNLNQLAELMNVNYRTIKHHADMLQKHEIITASNTGGYGQVFFLAPDLERNLPIYEEIVQKLQAVTTSPKFFQNVLEQTTDAIAIIDKKLEVFFWNESAVMLFGRKKEEVLGKPLEVFKDPSELKHALSHIIEGKHMVYFTAEAVDSTGKELTVEVTVDGIKDDENKLVGFSVLTTDITEQRSAEEKMAYQASLLARVNDAVIATDAQMKITFWNKAAETIYGYKASEVLGRSTREVLKAVYPGKTPKQLISMINKAGQFKGEVTQLCKDGRRIPVLARLSVIKDETGKITGYVTVNADLTEEKKAQEEIDKMASFPAINPNPVFELDMRKKITFSNSSLKKVTEELGVGQNALCPPNPKDLLQALRSRPEKPIYIEVQVKDLFFGESVHLAPEGDRLRVYAWDITEEKISQQALKINEARLRLAVESIDAGEWELDLESLNVVRSLSHDRIFGYRKLQPKWTFEIFLDHVIPEDRKLVEDTLKKVRKGGPSWNMECRIKRADGEVRWIWIAGRPKPTEGDKTDRFIGIILDVTEDHNFTEALRESEARFRAFAETTPIMIQVTRASDGTILYMNPTFEKTFGLKKGEGIGKKAFEVYCDPADRKMLIRMLEQKGVVKDFQVKVKGSDQKPFWITVSATSINYKGEPAWLGSSVDITERIQKEAELETVRKQLVLKEKMADLGRLASGLGQEISNPLTAIKNAVYYLRMVLKDPGADLEEVLSILQHELEVSETVVRNLMRIARTRPPDMRKVEVNGMIKSALGQLLIPEKVQLDLQMAQDLPQIIADPVQIEAAIYNIIINGIEAMPEGGKLVVLSEKNGNDEVIISVRDTGRGMPEDILARLYDPFFTTKPRKLGMGLPVAKTLVENHKGKIEVKSQAGGGSVFRIVLPVREKGG
jgi:PAS domain S-box-containing protein